MPEAVDLTDDELDAILADTKVTEEGDLDLTDIEVPEKEEAEEETKEEETEDSTEEETEEEEEAEEEAEEEEEDDEFAGLPEAARANMQRVLERMEEIETRNERLQADLDRATLLRDRNAGKAGALKQRLEAGDQKADPDEFDDDDEAKEKTSSKNSEVSEAIAEIRAEKVERAIGSASRDFYETNLEFFKALETQVSPEANQEFQANLVAKVREAQAELGEDLLTMSPKMAAKVSDTLLRSAFADMKLNLIQDLKKATAQESDESRSQVRARKKGAAGTRSNKRPAAKAATSKSVQQMTDKELDAALAAAANSFE